MHAPQLQYGLATEACADAYTATCAQEPHCAPSNAASALQWRRLDRGRWGLPTLANDHQTGCPRDQTGTHPPVPPSPFPPPPHLQPGTLVPSSMAPAVTGWICMPAMSREAGKAWAEVDGDTAQHGTDDVTRHNDAVVSRAAQSPDTTRGATARRHSLLGRKRKSRPRRAGIRDLQEPWRAKIRLG